MSKALSPARLAACNINLVAALDSPPGEAGHGDYLTMSVLIAVVDQILVF